jgi:hypothetical protein
MTYQDDTDENVDGTIFTLKMEEGVSCATLAPFLPDQMKAIIVRFLSCFLPLGIRPSFVFPLSFFLLFQLAIYSPFPSSSVSYE